MPHQSVSFDGKINLDSPVQPAVLAGILGISVNYVYQNRQENKLPLDPNTTYRQNIQHYLNWYKQKSVVKSSSIAEAKMLQDIRNSVARTELAWLDVKERKGELLDKQALQEVVYPIFNLVKSGLVSLAREMPETQIKVDSILRSWATLGDKIVLETDAEGKQFVADMIEKDPEVLLQEAEERKLEVEREEKDLYGGSDEQE